MKFVASLFDAEMVTLHCAYHAAPEAAFRQRAHAIILSHKGYQLKHIADILSVHWDTVSQWIDSWEQECLDSKTNCDPDARRSMTRRNRRS